MTISHIKYESGQWLIQTNDEHQRNVALLAQRFADAFDMGAWGNVLGLLHDKGKEQNAFQRHIRKESGYEPDAKVTGDYNHAYIGGLIAKKLFPQLYPLIANPVTGHHRGLYDSGDLKELLKSDIPQDVHIEPLDITLSLPQKQFQKYHFHHLVRFLFSCLVDADRLDTEAFMTPEQSRLRGSHTGMGELKRMLEKHLAQLNQSAPDTFVNKVRRYVQEQCVAESQAGTDFYSLTVPTGGGKTLASVLWALNHAVKNNLQRVIIAIPYTSIITQTAATLKNIFGEDNVLEHHSEVDYGDSETASPLQLATENWDYPIIVTTNVQFFESLFSNRPSQCRKLHNIASSVVIFDEVQTLPLEFYQPIIEAIKTLKEVFGTSLLFTTASQPVLEGNHSGFEGLDCIHPIIPESRQLHKELKRVEIEEIQESCTYDDIAERLTHHNRVLCIVNTRKDAKEIYERLPREGMTLHLSRMMCSAHIKQTIQQIKEALASETEMPIRVVSTQLIEAGVDIDFPVVYRQEAGLDSVLQAAGRCNREGKMEEGQTYVFSLAKEHNLPLGYISHTNDARKNMGKIDDWFSPDTISQYFEQLYSRVDSFDKKQICSLCNDPRSVQFEKAAEEFHLIEDNSVSVYVGYGEGQTLIDELLNTHGMVSYRLMKQLSQYSVNVRQPDFKTLQAAGAILSVADNIHILKDISLYDERTGLTCHNKFLEETIII